MEKREELYRGKTKAVFATDDPDYVILENFDAITKFDNPDLTKQMEGKAVQATKTTCNVFKLLKDAGLPVAFKEQISETEFVAEKCQMIPLEVIIRRYAVGSYLKRFPHLKKADGEAPHRFHRLMFELFLKTTGGEVKDIDGDLLGNTPVDDPLIAVEGDGFNLFNPKKPSWEEGANFGLGVGMNEVFGIKNLIHAKNVLKDIEETTRLCFLLLEGAWSQMGLRLIDFKIEFGFNQKNKLVIADVIDNDSWRLRTADWEELSKENFRQNLAMEEVSNKYALVAKLTDNFRIPKQAVVFWRGSVSDIDIFANFESEVHGFHFERIILSGHKSPTKCMQKLEEVLSSYPEGGVILAVVGMSNGLAPTLAARTSWPVIVVPASMDKFPDDVWSSLRVPSKVPLMTMLSTNNALLAAMNILAQKNPVIYGINQHALEKLDE